MNQCPNLSGLLRYELDALALVHAAFLNHENPDFDNEDDPANTWSALEAKQHLIDMLKADPQKLASLLPRLTAYVEHGYTGHANQPAIIH